MAFNASKPKDSAQEGMVPWDPEKHLTEVTPEEARYSRGFLRCRPERWFPGFEAHWLTLAHGFALELRVVDVRAFVPAPLENFARVFTGTVDNEQVALCLDKSSAHVVTDAFAPATRGGESESVLLEYLARRLLGSMALCWSGPESSVVRFDSEQEPQAQEWLGGVRLQLMLNGKSMIVWVMLGRFMLDRLDGLWRRQIHSSVKGSEPSSDLFIEVAQLAVPPSTLADYVRAGTAVDLEIPLSDVVSVRTRSKAIVPGRLRISSGRFCVETVPGQPFQQSVPDGTTRLSVCCGVVACDAAIIAEIAQPQAVWETGIPVSDNAILVVNGEKVADARLREYEGRFAIQV